MKKPIITLALASAALMPLMAGGLTLRYNRPAEFFEEAMVVGNGTLGAIVYGQYPEEKISLNDITLWTGEPKAASFAPEAYKAIPDIRKALDREDYRAADSLNHKVQGYYTDNYQPLATLTITHSGTSMSDVADYERGLCLNTASAFTSFSLPGGTWKQEVFASAPDSVIVVRYSGDAPLNCTVALSSQLPAKATAEGNSLTLSGHAAYTSLPSYVKRGQNTFEYDPQRGTRFTTILKVIPDCGTVTPNPDGTLSLKDVKGATMIITNATSFNGAYRDPSKEGKPDDALAARRISLAASKGLDKLRADQLADYERLFNRVSIDLGTTPDSVASLPTDRQLLRYADLNEANPDLEELYFQYGRYLLIASSRTHAVPANLQGLWNEMLTPPWSSNYTTNINVEENYWPAEVAGLGELQATAMLPWIKELVRSGEITARDYYGVNRGWCLGHNSDIWCTTNPVGMHTGGTCWANWNMGGAWVATHIWEHYLFSRNRDFLREYFPVLSGAAEFCLDWMVERDGELITSPSTSPENRYRTSKGYEGATLYGGAADLAMIRECLSGARSAALELNTAPALVKEIDAALSKLRPYQIGAKGNLCEWYYDWEDPEPTHRHQSHLFGLYPGHHISVAETPELADACRRTLEIKGSETTGWSTGWRVNLYARLLDSEKSYGMYRRLLRYVSPDGYKGADKRTGGGTYPNLLDAHSPFQIDGNFGGCAGVAEMLMQSRPESITLLPALPAQWGSGEVNGLRARGGFELSFSWADGAVTGGSIAYLPEASGVDEAETTLIVNGKPQPVKLRSGQSVNF